MKGLSHRQAIKLIDRRLDGLIIDQRQRLLLDEHLVSCDSCRLYAGEMNLLPTRLQNEFHARWDEKPGPSQRVSEHVAAKAGRIPASNRISSGVKLFASLAALLVAVFLTNFVVSQLRHTSIATTGTQSTNPLPQAEDRLLAFASDQNGNFDIYIMHPDGSGLTNLTNNPANDTSPFWSPDGRRISFISERDGSVQIYLMDADGSNVIQLTHGEGHTYEIDLNGFHVWSPEGFTPWSPDGRKLIFSSVLSGGKNNQLYVMDIAEENITTLTNEPGNYASPSWSPDGKHIAFVSYQLGTVGSASILVADEKGKDLTEVTKSLPGNEAPSSWNYRWSEDGNRVLFIGSTSDNKGENYKSTIYEAGLDGSLTVDTMADGLIIDWWDGTTVQLEPVKGSSLRWLKSDGSQSTLELCHNDDTLNVATRRSYAGNLAVVSNCLASGWMLYWANPDGTLTNKLLSSPIPGNYDSITSMTWLTWSPDDQFIAFAALDTTSADPTDTLYVLNVAQARDNPSVQPLKMANSSGPSWQPVVNNAVVEKEATPAVTPLPTETDNRLIAFSSPQNGNSDIFIINTDGSGIQNITNNPAVDTSPFWSPDGKRIAFESDRDGSTQIYWMDADGSNIIQLTNGEGDYHFDLNGYTPWSPDGKKLIFSHKSPGEQTYRLFVLDITDNNLTPLTNEPGQYSLPSWSQDGRHIAFVSDTGRAAWDLFVVGSDGSQLTKLTGNLPVGEFFTFGFGGYYWSPDGAFISFATQNSQGKYQSTVYKAGWDGSLAVIARMKQPIIDWWNGTALQLAEGPLIWVRSNGSQSTLDLCKSNSQIRGIAHKRSSRGNLIFGWDCTGSGWTFYLTNPDGTMINQLAIPSIPVEQDSVSNMTWSPDEQYIAFIGIDSASPDLTTTLYVLNVAKAREDSSVQPLKMINSSSFSWQPISNNDVVEEKPTPEPTQVAKSEQLPPLATNKSNGEWIAFIGVKQASLPDPAAFITNQEVYLIHPDGSELTNLTEFPAHYYDLQWSPDGQHLLFLRENPVLNNVDIMRHYGGVSTGVGEITRPFTDPNHYGYSWSPNSDKIVFADASGGNYDIYTVYADGRNDPKLTQLTNDPAQDVGFVWSPDGGQIAFQRIDSEKLSVMVMNEDGSDQREVVHGAGKVSLQWSQDGTSIYAASIENNWLECEGCIHAPAIYRIHIDESSVEQIYYEQDASKFAGWYLYDTLQNTLYFMRIASPAFLELWGTWMYFDGNSVTEIGPMDPHQTCKATNGNILHEAPNKRFSAVSNFCAGGFDLYLADRQASNPDQRLIHLLRLPLDTSGQGGDFATLPIGWSPDGRWLMYDNGNSAVYLLDVESALQNPTTEPALLFHLEDDLFTLDEIAWQPAP